MRSLSSLAKAALSGAHVVDRWIVRVNLPSVGWFGACDGPDTVVWNNGVTGPVSYIGLDAGLAVTLPPITGTPREDAASLTLAGTDPRLMASLLNEPYRGAPFQVCKLIFENGVTTEEFLKFDGWGGEATFADGQVKDDQLDEVTIAAVSLTVWPKTVDLKRGPGRWATSADQQLFRDVNDDFFQDVALVGVSQMNWGQAGSSSPAASAITHAQTGAPSGMASLVGTIAARTGGDFVDAF